MQTQTNKCRRSRGFSLVELLVVIAVIGVIASMAVANMTNVNENSKVAAAKAQAQNIAATFNAGLSAGAPSFKTVSGVASAMDAVGLGASGAGLLNTSTFKVKGVSSTMDDSKPAIQQAKHYLAWENGTLIYSPSGTESAPVDPNDGWGRVGSYALRDVESQLQTLRSTNPNHEFRTAPDPTNSNNMVIFARSRPNLI